MKKLLYTALLAVLCIVPSCSSHKNIIVHEQQQDNESTITHIKQRNILLVGTTGDYRPLTFRESDGTYWGFDIEMAEAIAKELNVEVRFIPTTWPTLTSDVTSEPQKFDLAIGGITITNQRLQTMCMSKGYLRNGKTILCRATDTLRFHSLSDINKPEIRVMVNPGGTNELFVKENLPSAIHIVHQRNEEIPGLVAEGKADIMITEITEAPYYISTDKRLAAPLLGKPFTNSDIGILMRKGQDSLLMFINDLIERMKNNGALHKLQEKYGFANKQEYP